MNKIIAISASAALAGLGLSAGAQAESHHETAVEQARIPFADNGGIRNWRNDDETAILIESRTGRWYRAEFGRRCQGLNFTNAVGFETRGTGSFDRYSAVRTRDDRCHVTSLVEIPDPDAQPDQQ